MSNIFTPKRLLIFTCAFYTLFSLTLIHPVNQEYDKFQSSTYGKQHRHVERVWNFGLRDAAKPFSEVKDHYLFHKKNPGMFKFIAEIFARIGFKTPIPLQILLTLMVNLGIIVQFKWLKLYFKNDIFPVVGCLFILGTHFLTFFGSTIHQHPYNFAFFNFCMYFIVKHVQTKQKKYFVYTWLCYFFLCQNYYMFWISTFVMMVGIQYFAGTKIISAKNFILGLAPVLTVGILLANMAYAHGTLSNALNKSKSKYMERVAGTEGEDVMVAKDYLKYPLTVSSRIERYFYIPGVLFILLAWILRRLRRANNSTLNYKFFYFLVPAGLSWYIVVAHVHVHQVAGRYSYFLWMIFFGYFFYEMNEWLKKKEGNRVKLFLKYNWIFILIYGVYGFGYQNLFHWVQSLIRIIKV